MSQRKPIIGGNWKMNTGLESGMKLASCIVDGLDGSDVCDVVIYPPFPFLQAVESVLDTSKVQLGAQNMWNEDSGAYTGETSATMLMEVGVQSVLIGHSERRHVMHENDALISQKAALARGHGLQVVLCVGETIEEREAGKTNDVVLGQVVSGLEAISIEQMDGIVMAYEPVWAIGTGKTASPKDAQEVHQAIRKTIADLYTEEIASQTRIQYGGSVKSTNATDLFSCEDIDGALVGGASLTAGSFSAIIKAAGNS